MAVEWLQRRVCLHVSWMCEIKPNRHMSGVGVYPCAAQQVMKQLLFVLSDLSATVKFPEILTFPRVHQTLHVCAVHLK